MITQAVGYIVLGLLLAAILAVWVWALHGEHDWTWEGWERGTHSPQPEPYPRPYIKAVRKAFGFDPHNHNERDGHMYDEGELDDMERLALAARRDPALWGARYERERRLAAKAAALGDDPAKTGQGTNPSTWRDR